MCRLKALNVVVPFGHRVSLFNIDFLVIFIRNFDTWFVLVCIKFAVDFEPRRSSRRSDQINHCLDIHQGLSGPGLRDVPLGSKNKKSLERERLATEAADRSQILGTEESKSGPSLKRKCK